MGVKFSETQLHSYTDVYLALLDAFDGDEDKAKKVMSPLVDLSVDIALKRMQEKASE